jgi:predicted PurR-regulated permease PerM
MMEMRTASIAVMLFLAVVAWLIIKFLRRRLDDVKFMFIGAITNIFLLVSVFVVCYFTVAPIKYFNDRTSTALYEERFAAGNLAFLKKEAERELSVLHIDESLGKLKATGTMESYLFYHKDFADKYGKSWFGLDQDFYERCKERYK